MCCRSSLVFFFAYLPISFLIVGIFRSSFLTYHGALTIVLSIFDCSDSSRQFLVCFSY